MNFLVVMVFRSMSLDIILLIVSSSILETSFLEQNHKLNLNQVVFFLYLPHNLFTYRQMHRDGTRVERSVTNPIKREKKKEGEIRYGVF